MLYITRSTKSHSSPQSFIRRIEPEVTYLFNLIKIGFKVDAVLGFFNQTLLLGDEIEMNQCSTRFIGRWSWE